MHTEKKNVSVKTTIFEVKRWLKEMYFISLSHFFKSWNCKCPCQISVIMAAAPNKASSQLSQNDTEPSSNCEDNESVLRMLTIALQFRTTYWLSWMHNQSYFSPSTMNGAKIHLGEVAYFFYFGDIRSKIHCNSPVLTREANL